MAGSCNCLNDRHLDVVVNNREPNVPLRAALQADGDEEGAADPAANHPRWGASEYALLEAKSAVGRCAQEEAGWRRVSCE